MHSLTPFIRVNCNCGPQNHPIPRTAVAAPLLVLQRPRAKTRMTIATSDGETIYAARYASHDAQPSLYHNAPGAVLEATDGERIKLYYLGVLLIETLG